MTDIGDGILDTSNAEKVGEGKMSLARALKEKNLLVKEISRLRGIMERENSKSEKSTSTVDCALVFDEYTTTKQRLVSLKSAIQRANSETGVQEKIYRLSEMKDTLSFFRGLETKDGKHFEEMLSYRSENPVELQYTAHFNQEHVDTQEQDINRELADLQDEIDRINATTFISV